MIDRTTRSRRCRPEATQAPIPAACSGHSRKCGYTMVEMAVILAIILVLGSIAIQQSRLFIAKSHRSEALVALAGVHKYQHSYFAQTGRYADSFDDLGFELDGAQRIDAKTIQGEFYTYTLTALSKSGVPAANYQATATGDIDPFDPVLDIVIIENDLTIIGSGGLPNETVSALRAVILSNDLTNQTTEVVHSS